MTREKAYELIKYESCSAYKYGITENEALRFISEIYDHHEETLKQQQHELGNKYQVELSQVQLNHDEALKIERENFIILLKSYKKLGKLLKKTINDFMEKVEK